MSQDHSQNAAKTDVRYTLSLALLVLGALLVGWIVTSLGGRAVSLVAVCVVALLVLYYLPELPFVILVMGMPIWSLMPAPIASFSEGIAIPLTLLWALVATALQFLRNRKRQKPGRMALSSVDLWMLWFSAWLWLGIWWSEGKAYGQFKALGFTAYTLSAYLIIRWGYHAHRPNLRRMAWLMLLAGIGHAAFVFRVAVVWGMWRPDQNVGLFKYRLLQWWDLSFIAEPDALTLGLIATLALLLTSKGMIRWFLVSAYLVQVWAFMFYQQRGATLALIAATILVVYYLLKRRGGKSFIRQKMGKRFVWLLVPTIVVFLFLLNPQFEFGGLATDANVSARLTFYAWAWGLFLSHPLVGVGTGGTASAIGEWIVGIQDFYVHNRLLEILSELGLVGFVLILALSVALFRCFQQTLRARPSQDLLFGVVLAGAALLSRYVVGMFSSDLAGWNIGVWSGFLVVFSRQIFRTRSSSIERSPSRG
jgi:O-antigen ligase